MKTKIIYIAPNNAILTYFTTKPLEHVTDLIRFYDDKDACYRSLPLDRCQISEVE